MRYIENGVQDKDLVYFFDSSNFDVYSYFIYFDHTAPYVELAGVIDETDVDFDYIHQDYSADFSTNIRPAAINAFGYLTEFEKLSDFTADATFVSADSTLRTKISQYINKIDYYNKLATRYHYYDHEKSFSFPFAEFIVIKLHDTDYVVKVMLNIFISKTVDTSVVYTLHNETLMSKYLYHYSSTPSDYTSFYMKTIYNMGDRETVNKENLVISDILYPLIKDDDTKLYVDVNIDCTTVDLSYQYNLFDLSVDDFIYLNNTYFCLVKDIQDLTTTGPSDFTVNRTYSIELIEFDDTAALNSYMAGLAEYADITHVAFEYFFNIRVIKKLNLSNNLYLDQTEFFRMLFSIKTFWGYLNRATDETFTDQQTMFSTPSKLSPITYSGTYDVTNNVPLNTIALYNSFFSDQYTMPYDVTIESSDITDGSAFYIDLFIADSPDVTAFISGFMRNELLIFNESGVQETMVLKVLDSTQLNANTYKLCLSVMTYDNGQYSGLGSTYVIPSNSYIVQYKYHIYNFFPYLRLNDFTHEDDLNNLITMHMFAFSAANPSVLEQNGREINF